jgi:hypothetical protein
VRFFSSDIHTAYSGSRDYKPNYAVLKEVRNIGDNEGYVSWGIGLSKQACMHVFPLSNPTRLVVDFQAP